MTPRPSIRPGDAEVRYDFTVPPGQEEGLRRGLEMLRAYVERERSFDGAPSAEHLVQEAGIDLSVLLSVNPEITAEYAEEEGFERPLTMDQARKVVARFVAVHILGKWRSHLQGLLDSHES